MVVRQAAAHLSHSAHYLYHNQKTDFAIQSIDNPGPLPRKEKTRNATMHPGLSLLISLSPCFSVWGFDGSGTRLDHSPEPYQRTPFPLTRRHHPSPLVLWLPTVWRVTEILTGIYLEKPFRSSRWIELFRACRSHIRGWGCHPSQPRCSRDKPDWSRS